VRFARTALALSATLTFSLPATALARHPSHHAVRRRHSKNSHARLSAAPETRIPEIGVTTLEPFGPPRPEDMPSERTVDTIEQVAVLGVHEDDDAPCTPDEIASGSCDDDEADGTDLEEVPAQDLTKKSTALHGIISAMKNVGAIFRPKSAETRISPEDEYLQELLSMNLEIPVAGVTLDRLQDSFLNPRGGRRNRRQHLALDIGSPTGTPVLAVTDGEIVRIGREKRGGNAIYLRDSSNRYLFYYCHLSHYTHGLLAGMKVKKGDLLGSVGATGNAHGAHLHFSVTRLPDDALDFRRGLAVNPYPVFLFGSLPK
jgi:peptidase M23-like protein